MRLSSTVTAVSFCCFAPLAAFGAAPPVIAPPAVPREHAPPTGPATGPNANTASDNFAAQAAARHAKRTACLKEAREKKLVGSGKNAYVKDCLER